MKNKLSSIIINNPSNMSAGYMLRDFPVAFATLAIWLMCLVKLYLFLTNGQYHVADMYPVAMSRIILFGFFITSLSFHFWSVYNKSLYEAEIKKNANKPESHNDNDVIDNYPNISKSLSTSSIIEHEDATDSANHEFVNG